MMKPPFARNPPKFKDGGKVKPFSGKDTKAEEMEEAKAVRSGKVSPKQYVAREVAEEKREGEKPNRADLAKKGKDLASGKMSAAKYGAMAKMADGGKVHGGFARKDVMSKTDGWAAHGSRNFAKMADGGHCGKVSAFAGKNMKKGGK